MKVLKKHFSLFYVCDDDWLRQFLSSVKQGRDHKHAGKKCASYETSHAV